MDLFRSVLCGHLFCWPCLHQWMETRQSNSLCPVCKSVVNKDEVSYLLIIWNIERRVHSSQVTPIYGKSGDNVDPRTKTVPPRPRGQRTEDPNAGQGAGDAFGFPWNFQQNGVHANVHFSFGFGFLPFSFVVRFRYLTTNFLNFRPRS